MTNGVAIGNAVSSKDISLVPKDNRDNVDKAQQSNISGMQEQSITANNQDVFIKNDLNNNVQVKGNEDEPKSSGSHKGLFILGGLALVAILGYVFRKPLGLGKLFKGSEKAAENIVDKTINNSDKVVSKKASKMSEKQKYNKNSSYKPSNKTNKQSVVSPKADTGIMQLEDKSPKSNADIMQREDKSPKSNADIMRRENIPPKGNADIAKLDIQPVEVIVTNNVVVKESPIASGKTNQLLSKYSDEHLPGPSEKMVNSYIPATNKSKKALSNRNNKLGGLAFKINDSSVSTEKLGDSISPETREKLANMFKNSESTPKKAVQQKFNKKSSSEADKQKVVLTKQNADSEKSEVILPKSDINSVNSDTQPVKITLSNNAIAKKRPIISGNTNKLLDKYSESHLLDPSEEMVNSHIPASEESQAFNFNCSSASTWTLGDIINAETREKLANMFGHR